MSGVATHVLNLSKQLKRMGHHVVVYSGRLGPQMPVFEDLEGVSVHHLPVTKIPNVKAGYIPSHKWLNIAMKEQFDIIHAHALAYFPSYTATVLSLMSRRPFVLTTHQPPMDSAFENMLIATAFNWGPARVILRKCAKIIALTALEARYLSRKYSLDSSKISIIPNGVELSVFRPASVTARRRRVLYVGRFSTEKGLFHLLAAMRHVLRTVPDASVTLVGSDGVSREVRELIQSMCPSCVRIVGPKFGAELAEEYANADVVVAPSLYETFGMVILEAMAVGLPVVAANVGGIPELVQDMVNGILVNPLDHQSLANAIACLLTNEALAARISQNNREKAISYSWERIAGTIAQVYSEIVLRE